MNNTKYILSGLMLLLGAPLAANNIITAEHPPFGDKGYALQFDDRLIYSGGDTFVNRKGDEADKKVSLYSDLFITRLYVPGWLFRLSVPYSWYELAGRTRNGAGDLVAEAGLSRENGPWRWRALVFANIPSAGYDKARENIATGAWSVGPNIAVTRYFADKKYDMNLWAQYAFNFANPETHTSAGNVFCYALAASALFDPGLPVRAAIEQRGLFGDPQEVRDSSAGKYGREQISIGPSLMVNLQKYLPGFTLWPTAQYDIYNRNTVRQALYYLKLQYNW